MSRQKGSKNRRTLVRDAEAAMNQASPSDIDCLHVMESAMDYFFGRALQAQQIKAAAEIVAVEMLRAVSIAEKIAPYRHARLSAVKLAGDPNNPVRFKDDATADELRTEIMKRLMALRAAGVLDLEPLEALPAPPLESASGIANQGVPGSTVGGDRGGSE